MTRSSPDSVQPVWPHRGAQARGSGQAQHARDGCSASSERTPRWIPVGSLAKAGSALPHRPEPLGEHRVSSLAKP